MVTEFLREHELAPESFPLRQWVEQQADIPPLQRCPGLRRAQAVCPSEAELKFNSRSRSAVLHILHKVDMLPHTQLSVHPLLVTLATYIVSAKASKNPDISA